MNQDFDQHLSLVHLFNLIKLKLNLRKVNGFKLLKMFLIKLFFLNQILKLSQIKENIKGHE